MEEILTHIYRDAWMLSVLRRVRDLNLPDCYVGAGFFRNKAWDVLHSRNGDGNLNDVDVAFFDSQQIEQSRDRDIESQLSSQLPNVRWEVVNQARTHIWHNRQPYRDTYEAIADWVETATCIGIRLSPQEELEFIAPHGTDDLLNLVVRPVPSLRDLRIFHRRYREKRWLERWPKLKVVAPDHTL